jgi:flagellar M-ring protein FliF
MLETQHNFEKSVEERLQSLLDKVVGPGKSAARVNANLDFKNTEKYEERYDPQASAVRSEQKSEQKENITMPSGVPGVQSNLGKSPVPPPAPGGESKNDETKNYEVSRSTSRIDEPAGAMTRISVAILVDGSYEKAAAKKGGAAPAKYVPRSPDELQKIEALVKGAIGFNAARGDLVTVVNIPFQEVAAEGADGAGPSWWEAPILATALKNLLIVLGFFALIFLVLRPMLNMLGTYKPDGAKSIENIEHTMGELGGPMQPAQLAMSKVNHLELIESVKKDPYQTAQVLQSWLKQSES